MISTDVKRFIVVILELLILFTIYVAFILYLYTTWIISTLLTILQHLNRMQILKDALQDLNIGILPYSILLLVLHYDWLMVQFLVSDKVSLGESMVLPHLSQVLQSQPEDSTILVKVVGGSWLRLSLWLDGSGWSYSSQQILCLEITNIHQNQ